MLAPFSRRSIEDEFNVFDASLFWVGGREA
jgi:hypothetical protein